MEARLREAHEKAALRLERREKKDDAPYLNSVTRVTSRIIFSILEFILLFVLLSLLVSYLETGTIDFSKVPDTVAKYIQPGGVIFTALVAYLPILVVSNIKVYFGLGTIPRMLLGIARYIMLMWWLGVLAGSAGNIDIVEMSGLSGSSALQGLESFTVNIAPMVQLLDIILAACCIIPVCEFLGARRRHNDAVIRHEDRKERKQERKLNAMEAKLNKREAELAAKEAADVGESAEETAEDTSDKSESDSEEPKDNSEESPEKSEESK